MDKNNESIVLRVRVESSTDLALKKVLEVKKISMQTLLESLINEYLIKNLDCFIGGKNG
ncbi:MAG: hypothetical protein PHX40_00170 [Bacilli bacterium]|nr:hypothetical protein [Bacilli bacterium]